MALCSGSFADGQSVVPVGLSRKAALGPHQGQSTGFQLSQPVAGTRAPWWSPVASAVIPGSGQFALGQQRSVGYAIAEVYFVMQALAARRDGNRDRDEYRALAADVARRPFSTSRPIGGWDYYESMEKFLASGVYDRVPGGEINPETDESTFNGVRWRLARETFWRNPDSVPATNTTEYQRAITFYTERAVPDAYRWSWRDAQLQQDVYRQTIESANRSYQRAVTLFGVVGANHLVSLIDAYITVRVRRFGGVRVAGLQFDGVETAVTPVGGPQPAAQIRTQVRLTR
ncbi:MAG: hypothetical protein IT353_20635 [Gemmatimonadaceae bacterium]|nr:hypothetical protein [Gemmatimonadaceae bacterium]